MTNCVKRIRTFYDDNMTLKGYFDDKTHFKVIAALLFAKMSRDTQLNLSHD